MKLIPQFLRMRSRGFAGPFFHPFYRGNQLIRGTGNSIDRPLPEFNNEFNYSTPQSAGQPPAAGELFHPEGSTNFFYISRYDTSMEDLYLKLLALQVGDIIHLDTHLYTIIGKPTANGTYVKIKISPITQLADAAYIFQVTRP